MPTTDVNLWFLYESDDIQNWAFFWSPENFFKFYDYCEALVVEDISLQGDPYVDIRLMGEADDGQKSSFVKTFHRSDLDQEQRIYLMQLIKKAHKDTTTKGREIRKRSSIALKISEKV